MNDQELDWNDGLRDCRIDKTAFAIVEIDEQDDNLEYWLAKTPQERFAAITSMLRIFYGHIRTLPRYERFFEVVERPLR